MRWYLLRAAASISGLALLLLSWAGLCTASEMGAWCDGGACPPISGACVAVPSAECSVARIDETGKAVLDGVDRFPAMVVAADSPDPLPDSEASRHLGTALPPPLAARTARYTLFASYLL